MLRQLILLLLRSQRDIAILIDDGLTGVDHLGEDGGSIVVVGKLRLQLVYLGFHLMESGKLLLNLLIFSLVLLFFFEQFLVSTPSLAADLA